MLLTVAKMYRIITPAANTRKSRNFRDFSSRRFSEIGGQSKGDPGEDGKTVGISHMLKIC